MQLVIQKSKFHGKPNSILQPISKPKSHKRNYSCFIKNTSQNTPLNSVNYKANFIEINRQKAKQTEISSPLSKYYLNLNQLITQKQQKITKQTNFLKKYSKKSPATEKQKENNQSQKPARLPTPRTCHSRQKKSSRSKRQFTKRRKQLLICNKVQPLLKTRYKYTPLDISRDYIVKSYQTIKNQYTFNRKMSKPKSSFIKESIQRLKKAIQKVSNRLMQTQANQHIQQNQKRQIFEYRRMLSVIKQELEQMQNSSRSDKRRKSNKFKTYNTQTTGLNKTQDQCLFNGKKLNIDVDAQQLDIYIDLSMSQNQIQNQNQSQSSHYQYSFNKTKSKNVSYELNNLKFQNKQNNKFKTNYKDLNYNESNLTSFQQSSFNSSKSFDCQQEINPWENAPQIIQDCQQINKGITSIRSIQSSQNRINSGHIGSKNKFSILKQKPDHLEKKKISVRKSGIKFIKNSFYEASDTRRGSIARFIQNRDQKDLTSIHHQTQGNQHHGKNKRHSDMSHIKIGKKASKGHRSSIRDKNKQMQNNTTSKSQLQIVENLISQTNFLQSQKSNSDDHNDQIQDTVDDQTKSRLSKLKKPILRSSNPILSILMLNQVQQSKDALNNDQNRNSKSIPKVNQYNPKYIYIDSHKSFTHNAKLLSSEIEKMKKFLQANNCAVEQLFQIVQDKERNIHLHVQKRSSSITHFNFQNKQNEPVFIAIKKNQMMVDSDDEPDIRSRYNDLVPLYYTEYTNPLQKGWIIFDQPLPLNKQKDQLYQQQMMQGVKLKDMLYFNRQYK